MTSKLGDSWAAPRLKDLPSGLWACFAEPEIVLTRTEIVGTIFVGFGTYMNRGGFIRSHVEIGRYCSIGRDVNIGLGVHSLQNFSTSPFFRIPAKQNGSNLVSEQPKRRVIIGSDVWIGDGAKISSGVTIGHGAVIAASAVVTKDVAPYSIVGGIPAKHIKWRFEESVRLQLLDLQWWEFHPEQLRELVDEDLSESIRRIRSAKLERLPLMYQRFRSKDKAVGTR